MPETITLPDNLTISNDAARQLKASPEFYRLLRALVKRINELETRVYDLENP